MKNIQDKTISRVLKVSREWIDTTCEMADEIEWSMNPAERRVIFQILAGLGEIQSTLELMEKQYKENHNQGPAYVALPRRGDDFT